MTATEQAPVDPRSTGHDSLFAHHPHAVVRLDLEGRILAVNPAAVRTSGHTAEQLIGTRLADLVEPRDLDRVVVAIVEAARHLPQRLELSIRRADGELADLDVTGIPEVVDDEVVGVYFVAEDITTRNRLDREREAARRLCDSATDVKADFVARMSHEIRTPLTGILAATELLAETAVTDEQRMLTGTLSRASRRLVTLVDNVLDFSDTDADTASGARHHVTEEFDLHTVIRDAVALGDAAARRKGLRVHLDLGAEVPRRVRDHPTWTTQILSNLLNNAIAYTETGHVEVAVTAATSVRHGQAVLYRVSDTGIGIDPAHQDLIFEPFGRAPVARATVGAGAGLGLSIVRQLVTISGGSVAVESAPGRGSTFSVLLPTRPVTEAC